MITKSRLVVSFIAVVLASILSIATPTNAQEFPFELPERSEEAYQDMVNEIGDVVERLRGKEWKHEVKAGVYTRQELMELLLQDSEQMKEQMKAEGLVLHKLGLTSREFDLYEALIGLYGQGVAGFFNPDNKELNIIKNNNPLARPMMQLLEDLAMRLMLGVSQEEMILAHELTHALDDQYYDLMNIVDMSQANSEHQLVRLAVTEGTAVSVQYDYLFRKQGIKSYQNPALQSLLETVPGREAIPGDGLENVPPMVVRQMLWPYTIGNRLVFEARKRDQGKWDTVNKMFEDLPASSEQVLHPEKYLDTPRDNPVVISLPSEAQLKALMGEKWHELSRDVMGEFRLWLYLEDMFRDTRSGLRVAKGASEGWDGDTMVVMGHGDENDEIALLWVSRWDSEEDAAQWFKTYRHILTKKYPDDAKFANRGDDNVFQFSDPDGNLIRLEKRANEVVILEGIPRDSYQNLLNICWSAPRDEWTRPPRGTQKPSVPWGK